MVIDWIDYIEYSILKNWKISQTLSQISEAIDDKEEKNQILNRLKLYLLKKDL